jgi:hypothetical protein
MKTSADQNHRSSRIAASASRRRGVMLLEVIVALGLLVFGLSIVGLQINSGLKIAQSNRLHTQAMMLVDSKLDEVEAGVIQPNMLEREVKGDFGIMYPGFSWRMEIDPTEIEGFYLATMTIGYRESAVKDQINDPKKQITFEDADTQTLRTAYRLFPKPADINLERDFGISKEDMDSMLADLSGLDPGSDGSGDGGGGGGGGMIGGGGAGGGGMAGGGGAAGGGNKQGGGAADGGGAPGGGGAAGGGRTGGGRGFVKPGAGGGPGGHGPGGGGPGGGGGGGGLPGIGPLPAGVSQQDLAALLKTLMEMSDSGSIDPRMLSQLPEEQFMALAQILETMGIGRGNMSGLKDMYQGSAGGANGGKPGLSRVGEGRHGFGKAGGRNGGGGQGGNGQEGGQGQNGQGQAGQGQNGQGGGANGGAGTGGNRTQGPGNRTQGTQRPPGGRAGGTGGGARGNSGNTAPGAQNPQGAAH